MPPLQNIKSYDFFTLHTCTCKDTPTLGGTVFAISFSAYYWQQVAQFIIAQTKFFVGPMGIGIYHIIHHPHGPNMVDQTNYSNSTIYRSR